MTFEDKLAIQIGRTVIAYTKLEFRLEEAQARVVELEKQLEDAKSTGVKDA